MKIDLSVELKLPGDRPLKLASGAPNATLRAGLHMALMTDPRYEQGPQQGIPRPLTAKEVSDSYKALRLIETDDDVVDLTTDEIELLKTISLRTMATLSLPIRVALERGVVEGSDDE